jgi:hypothetical protein
MTPHGDEAADRATGVMGLGVDIGGTKTRIPAVPALGGAA